MRLGAPLLVFLSLACAPASPRASHEGSLAACSPTPECPPLPEIASVEHSPTWREVDEALSRADEPSFDSLLRVELAIGALIEPAIPPEVTRARLDAMTADLHARIPRRCDARCRVAALSRYLFVEQHFVSVSDPDRLYDDVRNDLLSHVISTHQGYCVGLSHLYLTLAARLGLDASIVPRRAHAFVRVIAEDGAAIDIDTTRHGAPPRDDARCPGASPVFGQRLSRRALAARVIAMTGLADAIVSMPWLDVAARLDDGDPDLFNSRGVQRLRRQDLQGALDDFRHAAALEPCTAVYGVNEIDTLRALGRLDDAQARLDALGQTVAAPDQLLLEVQRALLFFERHQDAEADAVLLRALERWVGAPSILEARFSMRLAQDRAPEALRDVQAALAIDDSVSMHGSLVLTAIEAGDVALAAQALQDLDRRTSYGETINLYRARVAMAQGHDQLAERYARRCLQRFGRRCTGALSVLADVMRARGDVACERRFAQAFLACPRAATDRRSAFYDGRFRARHLP